jgi:hypothetical protein
VTRWILFFAPPRIADRGGIVLGKIVTAFTK